ncbi:MAG: hypothetical protein DI585_01675 [Pseudomonas fluorescens]|nr:MAG: hypothetical protein DI585_01675 [Pseudomonas fluorescens]
MYKLIVHVPLSHADAVRQAIGEAGGGVLGDYRHCSFSVRGVGRFRPMEGANPHIGEVGLLEEVEEEQIHVSGIGAGILKDVVAAVRAVHPYEEPLIEAVEILRF